MFVNHYGPIATICEVLRAIERYLFTITDMNISYRKT